MLAFALSTVAPIGSPCCHPRARAWLLLRRVSESLNFFSGKNNLEQRTHKSRASKNMGALFSRIIKPWATYPQVSGFQKYGGLFWEKTLEQRTHKLRASKNMGGFFSGKKQPSAT